MLDIILTVFAWRRGWKAWALLPMGITFIILLFVGVSEETIGLVLFFVLAELGTLIFMVVKPRKKSQQVTASTPGSPVVSVAPAAGEPLSQSARLL